MYVYMCIYIHMTILVRFFPTAAGHGHVYIYIDIPRLHVCRCLDETVVVTFLRPPAMAHGTIHT